MNISEELKRQSVIQDVRKYVMGATIEPNMEETKKDLITRCEDVGIDFSQLEKQCKNEIPNKRNYSEIIADTQIDGIERGLSLAFETLLSGKKLDTRKMDDQNGELPYSNGFSQEHRNMCRMEVLRALCISLKNDTMGYNKITTITEFERLLSEKKINPNLQITMQQLDYIHSIDLTNLEDFAKKVDISLIPNRII